MLLPRSLADDKWGQSKLVSSVLRIHAILSQLICYNANSFKVSSEGPHPTWAESDKILILHTLMLMF